MEYRIAKYSDYEMLQEWWKVWRFTSPPIITLPQEDSEHFSGYFAVENGVDVACGFLFKTNSTVCWIEYIVANPNIKSEEVRHEGVKLVLNKLFNVAKELGYIVAFSSIKHEKLIDIYKNSGFIEGSKGTTEMIKIL